MAITLRYQKMIEWSDSTNITPGLWSGVPNSDYHRGPGISKTGLDKINVSPLLFLTEREHPRPPTPALFLGQAIHAAVLEPELFARTYMPDPFPGSRSREAITARAELEANGFVVIKHQPNPDTIWDRGDWDTIRYVRDAVFAHPEAAIFLAPEDGVSELSCFWIDSTYQRLCKCRHDFYNQSHNLIVDLKTTIDATLSGFQRSTHEYRYDVAAAWYQDGTRHAGELVENMIFVVAEKKPPYHVGTYEIDREWVRQARAKYQNDLRVYDQCLREEVWPSIPDQTRVLPIPGYARYNPIS